MKRITQAQARNFVKAGVFPRPTSTEERLDLSDAFGHLPYKFCLSLLFDEDAEIRENARTLFKLVFDETTCVSLECQAKNYIELLNSLPELRRAAEEAQAALAKAERQLQAFEYDPEEDKR